MNNIKERAIFDFNFRILDSYLAFLPRRIVSAIEDFEKCTLSQIPEKNINYLICTNLIIKRFIEVLYEDVLHEKQTEIRKEDYSSYLIDLEKQVKKIRLCYDTYFFINSIIHNFKNIIRIMKYTDFNFTNEVIYSVMSELVQACVIYKKYYVKKNRVDENFCIKKRKLEVEEKRLQRERKKFKHEKEELEQKKFRQAEELDLLKKKTEEVELLKKKAEEVELLKKKTQELELKLKAEEKKAQAKELEMLQKKKQQLEVKLRSQKEHSRTRLEIPLSPEYEEGFIEL